MGGGGVEERNRREKDEVVREGVECCVCVCVGGGGG